MDSQITLSEFVNDSVFYNRDGTITECPKYARHDRCGRCARWQLLPLDEQPPDGWGVHGLCGSHLSKNKNKTTQTDYCSEFKDKYRQKKKGNIYELGKRGIY